MNKNRKLKKGWRKSLVGLSAAAVLVTGFGTASTLVYAAEDTGSTQIEATQEERGGRGPQGERPEGMTPPEMGEMPEGMTPPEKGEMPEGGFGGFEGGEGDFRGGHGPQGEMPEGMTPPEMGEMPEGDFDGQQGEMPEGGFGGGMGGQMGGQPGENNVTYSDEPSEIVESDTENTAASLTADEENAETIVMSDENSQVKIEEAGTYIITGSCASGNITVKKETTGVVLILKDLDLTSTSGATVSCNKGSEVQIVIEGNVKLTDAENPADESSADAETADAFDGAALKIKDGANVCLTGSGTLTIDASACKNGIKTGSDETTSFVIDGDLTLNITAANDAINSGYDLTILGGTLVINAGDDAVHADRILTVGSADGAGPDITIESCGEGLEGTVVNLFGGSAVIHASDDGINAANSDYTYADSLTFAVNITGGTWDVHAGVDGIDSNGDVNITGGFTTIDSAATAVDAGIDYDGSIYVADGTLDNPCGVAGPDGMGGGMGGRGGMGGKAEMKGDMNGDMETPEASSEEAPEDVPEDAPEVIEDTPAEESCGFFHSIIEFFRNLFRR